MGGGVCVVWVGVERGGGGGGGVLEGGVSTIRSVYSPLLHFLYILLYPTISGSQRRIMT